MRKFVSVGTVILAIIVLLTTGVFGVSAQSTVLPIEEQLDSIMPNMISTFHCTISTEGHIWTSYISPFAFPSRPTPGLTELVDGETYWVRMKNSDLLDYTNSEGDRYVYSLPEGVSQLVWQSNNPSFTVTGIVTEANGSPVVNATVSIDNEQNVVTNEEGLYVCSVFYGEHTITASQDGYKPQSQVMLCTEDATLSFYGTNSLVPNAPDKEYVLECINLWLYPDNPITQLPLEKVLAVINAYLYPR